jgi:hypothetical protein
VPVVGQHDPAPARERELRRHGADVAGAEDQQRGVRCG